MFFQQQTSSMDREALLTRVAEAAAKEADAVTKLGQLTYVPCAEIGRQLRGTGVAPQPPAARHYLPAGHAHSAAARLQL